MSNSLRVSGRKSIHGLEEPIQQFLENHTNKKEEEKENDTSSHCSEMDNELLDEQEENSDESSETNFITKRYIPECQNTNGGEALKPQIIYESKVLNENFKTLEKKAQIQEYKNTNKDNKAQKAKFINKTTTPESSNMMVILLPIAIVLVGIFTFFASGHNTETASGSNSEFNTNNCDNKDIDTNSDVWLPLKSGIKLVLKRHQPSIFLYIYKDLSEDYIDNIIKNLSEYASCSLKANDSALELTKSELSSSRAKENFGYIIEKYQNQLREQKVMVVKHLEQVPGVVAQVFHVFCDEHSPLVEESVIIFTMKVDHFDNVESDSKLVEDVLRKKWSELHEDIFEPLIARLSNMIVRIDKLPDL